MKKLIFLGILVLSTLSYAQYASKITVRTILDSITTTATGTAYEAYGTKKAFQLVGATATGTGAATARVDISNDASNWITTDTLSLTLSATSSSDSYFLDAPWKYMRGIVHSISGTGATVSLTVGEESRF